MPNPYFRFKQFTVWQHYEVLRVSTEACLLGAIARPPQAEDRVLDIGAGTGLLSLMLAQKQPEAQIEAIEIDRQSQLQCLENFAQSKWQANLHLIPESLQAFYPQQAKASYDYIISNPPFFAEHSLSPQAQRNLSKHQSLLSHDELYEAVRYLLKPEGQFWLLLPPAEMDNFRKNSPQLHAQELFQVHNRPNSPMFRQIVRFTLEEIPKTLSVQKLFIREASGIYHSQFVALLKPYYLIF